MGKSLKRNQIDSDEYSELRNKTLKKRKIVREFARPKSQDYFDDDEASQYLNDPKVYRAIKEYC